MTHAEIVEKHIKQAFINAAAEIAGSSDLTQDEAAGVPSLIFHAQRAIVRAWREYVGEGDEIPEVMK